MIDLRQLLTSPHPRLGVRLLRWCLRLASVPYLLVVLARNLAYDRGWKKSIRARLPVISVGNLTVGGTGKSPTVAWLAKWFRQHDTRVAILSRGYGRLDGGQNDEALELERQLPDVPHLQHWDRIASAALADQVLKMELLLLDDGFQHRRIARDLEIVLLDATDPPAARWLLPGGLMREPQWSLGRADVIALTRIEQVTPSAYLQLAKQVQARAPNATIIGISYKPSKLLVYPDQLRSISEIAGKRLLAFCAIGNPETFFRSVTELGGVVLERRTWRDHHGFTAGDISSLAQWTEQFPTAELLVCTMKDWVKIQRSQIGNLDLVAVQIEAQISEGLSELEAALSPFVTGRHHQSTQ